jgi:hypothetical protein
MTLKVFTRSGLSPEDFFSSQKNDQHQTRAVFTIGISGSGKSHWSRIAEKNNWNVLNSDSIRVNWLKEAQKENKKVLINGQLTLPDPSNEEHVFCPELRALVMDREYLLSLTKLDQAVVFDITNLTLQRVPLMLKAMLKGYAVEALVFAPNSLEVHQKNVSLRKNVKSGLGVSEKVISDLHNTFQVFCTNLKANPQTRAIHPDEITKLCSSHFDFTLMRKNHASFEAFLSSLNSEQKAFVKKLQEQDVFSRIEYVDVQEFA